MRRIKLLVPIVTLMAAFGWIGCSQQEEPQASAIGENTSYRLPLETAIELGNLYVSGLDESETRATKSRAVSSVKIIKDAVTRSNSDGFQGYYVINYDGDEGFALVSADKRLPGVFAVSNECALNIEDTVFNEGLRTYLNLLPSGEGLNGGTIPPTPGIGDIKPPLNKVVVSPLLPAAIRKWSQGAPYNQLCINKDDPTVRDVLGCGPVAVGKVMGYYQWPEVTYDGIHLDWDEMEANQSSQALAAFLKKLGDKDLLNASYSPMVTGVSPSNIPPTFKKLGYFTPVATSFNETTAINHLTNYDPVLICGYDTGNAGGHAWVIDGIYRVQAPPLLADPEKEEPVYSYYLHTDWGWGGTCNGYYSYSSGTVSGSPEHKDSQDKAGTLGYKFSSLLMYWTTPSF